jgi:hypothetical protein
MPSLAANIRDLLAKGWQRSEILSVTGCTDVYLRSVLSRARAPDAATRKRRLQGGADCGRSPLRQLAENHAKCIRDKALRRGLSRHEANRAGRKAYLIAITAARAQLAAPIETGMATQEATI